MRVTTLLRRLLGVTQMHVRDAHVATDGPLSVWVRSRRGGGRVVAGAAVGGRATTGDRCGSGGTCRGDGRARVAAVCAVAGVVPAVRRAGGAGAVGGRQQRVHGAVRRVGRRIWRR